MRFSHVIIFLFATLFASAQSQILHLDDTSSLVFITDKAMIYEDVSAKLTLEELLNPEIEKKFTPSPSVAPNYNITKSAIWLKYVITTKIAADWQFESCQPNIQNIDFYILTNGKIRHEYSGINTDPSHRIHFGHLLLFDLEILPGDTVTVYVRYEDLAPLKIMNKAGTLQTYFESEQRVNFWHGIYFGIIIIMVVYNLFLFFTNLDRVYIYYVLYIIFTGFFIFFFNGYVMIFPEWMVKIFVYVPVLIPAAFGIFGLLFTRLFLDTKNKTPKLDKVILFVLITVNIPVILSALGFGHLSIMMIQFFGILLSVVSIVSGILVYRKGYGPAKYYVIGFGAYMIGLFFLITSDLFGITNEFLSLYAMETGSAIEAIMLSFAIGDKLNQANKEKEFAREESLSQAKENERIVREQNIILEQKVKERTSEINEQKEIIEEKQKEIVDSINYAKRIQYSLLAHDELLKSNLNDHFVLFQPKDIVSGDFYWATSKKSGPDNYRDESENEKSFYLAVCDSTGHGVPGAFMSLLNISFLNEAITEKNISEPHLILNHVRERLIQNMEGGQDGMDAILVRFKVEGSKFKVEYAAANNHPVLISYGELKELPADKMPVGKGERMESFTLHEIAVEKGDMLYLFTDGYADQFGGPKGKKFKYSNLSKLLLEIHSEKLETQNSKLETYFSKWKGDLEQVDDVCIIGIRL